MILYNLLSFIVQISNTFRSLFACLNVPTILCAGYPASFVSVDSIILDPTVFSNICLIVALEYIFKSEVGRFLSIDKTNTAGGICWVAFEFWLLLLAFKCERNTTTSGLKTNEPAPSNFSQFEGYSKSTPFCFCYNLFGKINRKASNDA